jgi:hypothetical protein
MVCAMKSSSMARELAHAVLERVRGPPLFDLFERVPWSEADEPGSLTSLRSTIAMIASLDTTA